MFKSRVTAGFKRAVALSWQGAPALALAHAILIVVQAVLPFVALLALERTIDLATPLLGSSGVAWRDLWQLAEFRQLLLWITAGAAAIFLSSLARVVTSWVAEFHALAVTEMVYDQLHTKLMSVDYPFFENPDDQNRLYLAREQALSRPPALLANLGELLRSGVGLAGVVIILSRFNPLLAVILLFGALPVVIFRYQRAQRFYRWRQQITPLERSAGYFHSVMSDNAGARDIRLYGHGEECRRRFKEAREGLRQERLAWRRYLVSRELAGVVTALTTSGLILLWMFSQLLSGAVTLGGLVLCVQALQRGQAAVGRLLQGVMSLFEDAVFLQSFEELMQLPNRIAPPPQPLPIPEKITRGIRFENVTFTYPGCRTPVFANLNLEIKSGEHLVLRGPNGCGKSTLIKLLCRLYDPDSGRITVDGTDLRHFDPDAWRRSIGVLFQEFNHYQMSVADNIRLGEPGVSADDPRVEQAALDAGLEEQLREWRGGLNALLGRWLHDGIEPSMGQWQKIALARAFVRPALLYILDEPTSALDDESQRQVVEALRRIAAGRIALIASHREIEGGRIQEFAEWSETKS